MIATDTDSVILSLEYDDNHLHNEYGEITSRWEDEKIENAAKDYFDMEEKEAFAAVQMYGSSTHKSSIKGKKKGVDDKSVRSKKMDVLKRVGDPVKAKGPEAKYVVCSVVVAVMTIQYLGRQVASLRLTRMEFT